MLIVLHRPPVSAPSESVGGEQAVAFVATKQPVVASACAVGIFPSSLGLHAGPAIPCPHTGVVERIDVHRHPPAVGGKACGTLHPAEVEARRVVGRHGTVVIAVVDIRQSHAFDGIPLMIELAEDGGKVLRDTPVTHHFSQDDASFGIAVEQAEIAEVGTRDGAALPVGLPHHASEYAVGDVHGHEAVFLTICRYAPLVHHRSRLPLPQTFHANRDIYHGKGCEEHQQQRQSP